MRDEIAYQFVKAGKEIAADLEYAIIKNDKATPMAENVAGTFGGIPYFLDKDFDVTVASNLVTLASHGFVNGDALLVRGNASAAANTPFYVAVKDANSFYLYDTPEKAMSSIIDIHTGAQKSSGEGAHALADGKCKMSFQNCINAAKDVAKGALTFDILNDAMELTWKRGGNPTVAIMSAHNKRGAAGFTQGALPIRQQSDGTIKTSLEVIETDFGSLRLEAHRMYSDDVVDLLDTQYWKLGYLIPFHTEQPPRVGTYTEKVITGVVGLECTAPNANARIKGLNGTVTPKPVIVETIS